MVEPSTEERAREVADRYWDRLLELEPIAATQVGDDCFDDRLPAGLARSTAEVEVDRYISWPGQALAYKTGQVEIQRLRAEAASLPGFSLPAWHDKLLELGTLPLLVLRKEMQDST